MAILSSSGVFIIAALAGYIMYAAVIQISKIEEDYVKMTELKVQAESADVAKSQVPKPFQWPIFKNVMS